jgi:hypothetical protein
MRGVVLVPNDDPLKMEVLWLDNGFAMYYTRWEYIDGYPWGPDQPGVADFLGGKFTSPPAAISPAPNRLDVFGLGQDYAVYHKVHDATAKGGPLSPPGQWTPDWENLGGNFTSTPVVLSTATNHIDLFGLGIDQGMLYRSWSGSVWGDWDELGGGFTSLPVALPGTNQGEFDLFARGLDFQLYHLTWKPNAAIDWQLLGGGLLGEQIAASAPAAVRVRDKIFVFVTASDGAVWYTAFDSKVWKPWASLGVAVKATKDTGATTFVTEPVVTVFFPMSDIVTTGGGVISTGGGGGAFDTQPPPTVTGHMRVDVFCVGDNGDGTRQLFHKWLDPHGWHGQKVNNKETGDWELVGSSFACAPSIVAPNRARTVVAMPPVHFSMVEPNLDHTIHLQSFDGTQWTRWNRGPNFQLPSCYTFSVDAIDITDTRSLHNDTDLATATFAAGKWPVQNAKFDLGDVNNSGYALYNLQFPSVIVELCEPAVLTYMIVNSGNSDKASAVYSTMLKGSEDAINDWLKQTVNPNSTAIVGGAAVITEVGGGPTIVGSLLGAAAAFVLESLLGLIFADCDGVVASETIAYQKGRDIWAQLQNSGQTKISGVTQHPGTDSPSGCGANSNYTVYWSISPS